MTARKRIFVGETDDPSDLPLLEDGQIAESTWLLARDHDPGAPAPSPEIAAGYAALEALLGSLPPGCSDESWHDEVLRAADALTSRPWWRGNAFRWAIGGALATATAAVVWIRTPYDPELEVAVYHTGAIRGGRDEAAVGDRLIVTARPREAGDLRIYRSDGALIARCPRGAGCRVGSHGAQIIEITLDAPVQYQIILVDGVGDGLPDGTLDLYMDAARAAHARITVHRPIDVH